MKLWTGIVTPHLHACRDFYVQAFGCNVLFDEDWFVLLELGGGELGLLAPDLDIQHPRFRTATDGQGSWVTIDVEDVQAAWQRLAAQGITPECEIREESWGDRHFVVTDPAGIAVDIVQRSA